MSKHRTQARQGTVGTTRRQALLVLLGVTILVDVSRGAGAPSPEPLNTVLGVPRALTAQWWCDILVCLPPLRGLISRAFAVGESKSAQIGHESRLGVSAGD